MKSFASIDSLDGETCVSCGKPAVVSLRYGPHRFCKNHFLGFFERRVRKTIRINRLVNGKELIAVGVSGGKDSLAALYLLKKILGKVNRIHAIMVDEGISGYRDNALAIAKKNCEEWGIDYSVVKLKDEFGVTMTEVMNSMSRGELGEQGACSFCGVFRRSLLNKAALELGAGKIATGHNLNDECQSILMNIASNDVPRLSRLGPIAGTGKINGFVPRIKPLYDSPENEVLKFAESSGIEFCRLPCCPFSWNAKRNVFRKVVDEMEKEHPGTMFSIIASLRAMKPFLEKGFSKESSKGYCESCGSPSGAVLCNSCFQLKRLKSLIARN